MLHPNYVHDFVCRRRRKIASSGSRFLWSSREWRFSCCQRSTKETKSSKLNRTLALALHWWKKWNRDNNENGQGRQIECKRPSFLCRMEDQKLHRKKTPPLLALGSCGRGCCRRRKVQNIAKTESKRKRGKNLNRQGNRQRECSLTKLVASGERWLRSSLAKAALLKGDEKLKTSPK